MTATGAPISPARTRGPRSADGQVVGALLILGGLFWLGQRSGIVEMSWETSVSVLLIVLGVGLVITARSRGGGGLIVLGVVLTLVLASTSSIDVGVLKEGVGDRTFRPKTVAQAEQNDSLGVGSLDVDLRDLEVPEGETVELTYTMAVGELVITLPDADDVPVRIRATMQGGDMEVLGQRRNGGSISVNTEDDEYDAATRRLDIRVTMAFGNLQVSRAPL